MNIKARAIIFSTFFINCIIIGFLVASLTTDHWIHSSPKRHNTTQADGHIHFGLFGGEKHLNVGYGTRIVKVDIPALIRQESNLMNYWLWLWTALGVGFGLFSSAVAAIASVLQSASDSKKRGTMILLIVSNCASAISQMIAFICWMVQFYQYLTHNVLEAYDIKNSWYSKDLSDFGHSFYFIVVGIVLVFLNLILLCIAVHSEKRQKRRIEQPYDEKLQGAIMLY